MSSKEILEQLCNKVADIKYELQQVLDTLYELESGAQFEEKNPQSQPHE